ncbi:MAG: hypothetical protein ACXIUL_14070 [Wenzhouxiangella sp.]
MRLALGEVTSDSANFLITLIRQIGGFLGKVPEHQRNQLRHRRSQACLGPQRSPSIRVLMYLTTEMTKGAANDWQEFARVRIPHMLTPAKAISQNRPDVWVNAIKQRINQMTCALTRQKSVSGVIRNFS